MWVRFPYTHLPRYALRVESSFPCSIAFACCNFLCVGVAGCPINFSCVVAFIKMAKTLRTAAAAQWHEQTRDKSLPLASSCQVFLSKFSPKLAARKFPSPSPASVPCLLGPLVSSSPFCTSLYRLTTCSRGHPWWLRLKVL